MAVATVRQASFHHSEMTRYARDNADTEAMFLTKTVDLACESVDHFWAKQSDRLDVD